MPASARRSVYLIETYWTTIAVVDQVMALPGAAIVKRLFQGVENEAGLRCARDPPADDPPGEGVDDEGYIDETHPCGDVGKVGNPQGIRSWRSKLAVHPVLRARRGAV